MRIIVDAMGGDHAPQPIVAGAVLAARAYDRAITLVGAEDVIRTELARFDTTGLDILVHHAPDVIAMHETSPVAAIRANPNTSIAQGMMLVRRGEGEAFVTAGHTGATVAGGVFRLGRIHGVRRPALATPFPTLKKPCVLVDVGASADARPEYLLQYGIMGSAFARVVLGVDRPRVGLVTIGEERGKGNQMVQDALPLFEASDLNFIGNVEGRDVPLGDVDVAVLDGFTGNVMVKFGEGMVMVIQQLLSDAARSGPVATIGGALIGPALRRAWHNVDYRRYGGASLLGVRGVVVIGHGRSDAEAVKTAVGVALKGVENGLVQAIGEAVARQPIPRVLPEELIEP